MEWKRLNELPNQNYRNSRTNNNRMQSTILDFYESDADYCELEFDFGEYATSYSVYSGAKKAVQALKLPIDVLLIRGGVYLRRND